MAEVTKRHRELIIVAEYGSVDGLALMHAKRFVNAPSVDAHPLWMRLAQALADIEAEALAAAQSATLLAQMANVLWNLGRGAELTDREREICKRLAAEYDASRKTGNRG